MPSYDRHTEHILDEIGAGRPVSQRSLSRDLGIALGLTNLLMRRFIRKGWVRATAIRPNRMRYFLTPAGFAEKARISGVALQNSVAFYRQVRQRLSHSLTQLVENWPLTSGRADRRIFFYGTGEVAEIAYICLQEAPLTLVGVIDDEFRRPDFFGVAVHPLADLSVALLDHLGAERLVVMTFTETDRVREALDAIGFPMERVFWV